MTVPNSLYDPVVGSQLYNRYLDELIYAEELGFDGVCVNEHHQNAYGNMPSPNLIASILARQTSRVKIAVVGNALPLYDPPTRVAEEFAMIDVISGGRLIAGMVVGGGPGVLLVLGEPVATRGSGSARRTTSSRRRGPSPGRSSGWASTSASAT